MQLQRRPISTLKKVAATFLPVVTVAGFALVPHNTYAMSSVTVDQNDSHGWAFFDDEGHGGTGKFIIGPDTAPTGSGRAQLELTGADQGYALGMKSYGGTKLRDITNLSYNTNAQTGNNVQAPALQMNIDPDMSDSDTAATGRLVYEPYYSHTVTDSTWQQWNTQDNAKSDNGKGNWWLSDTTLADQTGCSQSSPCTWDELTKALPNGGISSSDPAVLLKAGSGWKVPFLGNVDNVTIGVKGTDTSYDFEYAVPSKIDGLGLLQANKVIGCDAVVNNRMVSLKWDANTDASFDHYVLQADADKTAPFDSTTNITANSSDVTLPNKDGAYNYRVAAVDTNGVQGEWSDWCTITLDTQAPSVQITSPRDDSTVSGRVTIRGSVTDDNPSHYYLKITGPNGTVFSRTFLNDESFTNASLYKWNTRDVKDGEYTIRLEARDAAGGTATSGNKDASSVAQITVNVQNRGDQSHHHNHGHHYGNHSRGDDRDDRSRSDWFGFLLGWLFSRS